MNTNLPLEELILTLLALAEAAPHLDEKARAALAEVAEGLREERDGLAEDDEAGLVDVLTLTQVDIVTELYGHAAFQAAKTAWGEELAMRTRLGVKKLNKTLINPDVPRSTGVTYLTETVEEALLKPDALAQNKSLLDKLTALINRTWPRRKA